MFDSFGITQAYVSVNEALQLFHVNVYKQEAMDFSFNSEELKG